MSRLRFSRRRLLGNAALMTVAAPFVRSLNALAAEAPPPRLVTLFSGNGHRRGFWATRRSDTDFDLLRILQPLEKWKGDMVLFKGLNAYAMRRCRYATTKHGLGSGIAFTGVGVQSNGWPNDASVDQLVAGRLKGQTPLASLQLGAGCHDTNVYGRVSYAPGGKPLSPEQIPANAYATLFKPVLERGASGGGSAADAERLLARRKSVLDFVREDVCALRAELGSEDRKRLEVHCESFREVERGLSGAGAAPADAKVCAPPSALLATKPGGATYEQALKDHIGLTRLALQCRLTSVVSLQLGQAHGGITASRVAVSGGHHHLSHWRGSGAGQEPYIKISVFYAQMVGHLLETLKAVEEPGGGSLLDHTVLCWGTDVTDGEEHGEDDIPWAVFGGRRLGVKTGRMLDAGKKNQNDVLIALCHAMGLRDVKTVGLPDLCTGPLPGML
jgi:hypothetical protein